MALSRALFWSSWWFVSCFVLVSVMVHGCLCHGLWWSVVICDLWWFMSNLWWFIVICGDLWWFMSTFVVVHVMVCGGLWYFHFHCSFSQDMGLLPLIPIVSRSYPYFMKVSCKPVENWLRYWSKHSVFVKTWGCCPLFRSSRKVNPTSWRFRANPSRIDWDIDQNVQF